MPSAPYTTTDGADEATGSPVVSDNALVSDIVPCFDPSSLVEDIDDPQEAGEGDGDEEADEEGDVDSEHFSECDCSQCGLGHESSDDARTPISFAPFPRPLPSDLIKPICEHLRDDTETLLSIQASCQAGWSAATCLLYRTITLETPEAWFSLFAPWDPAIADEMGDNASEPISSDSTSGLQPLSSTLDMVRSEDVVDGSATSQESDASAPPADARIAHTPLAANATGKTTTVIADHLTATTENETSNLPSTDGSIAGDAPGHPGDHIAQSDGANTTADSSSHVVTPAQIRVLKALSAARKLIIGAAPPDEVAEWFTAASRSAGRGERDDVLLLRNVHAVCITFQKRLAGSYVDDGGDSALETIAQLCEPTTLCIDFGSIHFGEDSPNYATCGKVNKTSLDEEFIALVTGWTGLKQLNIHSTTSAYPITTHFSGIHTRMYVTPPPHKHTIKGDDGYAIAVQIVKLIVSYIQDDYRNDNTTRFEMSHIHKFVHHDVTGMPHSDVPYMAWLRGGLPWTASEELEAVIKHEMTAGRMNGERADELRDRLDRFFEGDVLKFGAASGMDKCEGCDRE